MLDEAQMIEGKFTAAAKICDCLSARHRWCVTGTPIQREINDLHGLFSFLRHPLLSHGDVWRKIVKLFDSGDVVPFLNALRPLFWRHSKHHVDAVRGCMDCDAEDIQSAETGVVVFTQARVLD